MANKILRYSLGSDLVIYVFRCVVGFLIGYKLYLAFPDYELYWTSISIMFVISPQEKDSRKLAKDRLMANLIGSGAGLVSFFLHAPPVVMILAGILITIAVCYIFKLMSVARIALVTLLIVLIHEQEELTAWAAIERFVSTTIGCLVGLGVTVVTSVAIHYLRQKLSLEQP